jgi:HK97 family phage major capsid protein
MRKSIELRNEKGVLVTQYRGVLDKVTADKRKAPNTEEAEQLRKMDAAMDELEVEIARHEKQEQREAGVTQIDGGKRPGVDPADPAAKNGKGIRASAEYGEAFNRFLAGGKEAIGNVSPEIRNALQSDSDVGGGYLTASEEFSSRLIEVVDNEVFVRRLATKTTLTTAQSLGIPARTADVDDAVWTSEIATGTADTGLVLGKREFKPHPLAKRILISKKLLRLNSAVQDLVIRRLGYKVGVSEEKAYMSGSGAEQPLGVFTASASGIDTSRDVKTGSATGFVTPSTGVSPSDCITDMLYGLKAQYQANATFIFNRTIVQEIRKFKDLYNQYIWQPGLTAGEPDRILNRPFYMSEYAPNTKTNGKYIGVCGDFSKYEIVDALNIEIQVLLELYAETNQVGYIARMETDGMPVLAEAFTRLICST